MVDSQIKERIIEDSRKLAYNSEIIESANITIKDCNNFLKPLSEYAELINSNDSNLVLM